MGNFNTAYNLTMKAEGGYANNPNDKGGETYKGIARKKNPQWKGWTIIDTLRKTKGFPAILESNKALQTLKLDFYKSEFWDKLHLDEINNQAVTNEMFDTSVNMGQAIAAGFLQRALNTANRNGLYYPDLEVDSKISSGGATIKAMNKHPRPEVIYKILNSLQGMRYINIAEQNKSQEEFINGWFDQRIASLDLPDLNSNIA